MVARCICSLGLVVASLGFATTATAQSTPAPRGSRFIATDDWMNDAIIRLRERGLLGSLDALAQPWQRNDVAREVARIPVSAFDTMPRPVAHWLRLLRSELGPELQRLAGTDSLKLGYAARVGVVSATSPRIDPLMPLRRNQPTLNGKPRDGRGFWQYGSGEGWAEDGPFALNLRLGWNLALRHADPDGRDPGRVFDTFPDNQETYGSATFANGSIVVGRLHRNWAPVGTSGLGISDNGIGISQIGYEVGSDVLKLRGFVGELDTLLGNQRWVVAHRLEYNKRDFAASIGEEEVYGSNNGPLISNLNPVEVFFITDDHVAGESPSNSALDGQFWARHGGWTFGGEAFMDDIWISHHAPMRAAGNAFTQYVGANGLWDAGLAYRRVTSFTYWTIHDNDRLTFYGRSLGDEFSDYDRLTFHTDYYPPVSGLRLTPTLAYQRKGEWDYRKAGIPDSVWKASPTFLQGIPEKTARAALAGRYQPTRLGFIDWDAGVNFVSNANHVNGYSLTEFSAMLKFGVVWSGPDRRAP